VGVRFPNESFFEEIPIDLSKFVPEKEFENETFGYYGETYISIRKYNGSYF